MRTTLLWLLGIGIAAFGIVWLITGGLERPTTAKKVPHYESTTPESGVVLPAPPPSVVIDVNFDLAKGSTIAVLHNGTNYGTGETTIDANKLAMRRAMQTDVPDGTYTVTYTACWPDGSCHDGFYSFEVDRTRLAALSDSRGQQSVMFHLKDLVFEPMEVRISAGTTVTWVNDDVVVHYVNTDFHPAHTHVPDFNSAALKQGETYSYTFAIPGAYPYHCSAHAGTMTGIIVVD